MEEEQLGAKDADAGEDDDREKEKQERQEFKDVNEDDVDDVSNVHYVGKSDNFTVFKTIEMFDKPKKYLQIIL